METAAKTKSVDAVIKALNVLKVFNHRQTTLSLSEISQQTGLVKSTTLRMLVSLIEAGFVIVDRDKRYSLGPEVFRLGRCYVDSFNLEQHVRPVMKQLVNQSGESVSFFQRVGDQRVCLFREDSRQALREHVAEGDTVQLDRGAAGRVLIDFADITGRQPDHDDLLDTLPYLSYGEREIGITGLAVPVFSAMQGLVGAMTISGPDTRLTPDHLDDIKPMLFDAAVRLSASMGAAFYNNHPPLQEF